MSDVQSVTEEVPIEQYRGEVLILGQLATDPSFAADVREIIEKQLRSVPVTVDTIARLFNRMIEYLGQAEESVARLLVILVSLSPDSEEIDRLLGLVEEDAHRSALAAFVRRLRALYYEPLGKALAIGGQLPDDWHTVNAEGLYLANKDAWEMEVRITKYNDEHFLLRCPPSALVGLMAFLLNSINRIPASAGDQLIPPEQVRDFILEFEEFERRFGSQTGEATTNHAVPPEGTVAGTAAPPG